MERNCAVKDLYSTINIKKERIFHRYLTRKQEPINQKPITKHPKKNKIEVSIFDSEFLRTGCNQESQLMIRPRKQ